MARYVHNDRLRDALGRQAYSALTASPRARAYYDELRDRNIEHEPALRQLANRLAGILHGRLKTRTLYNEQAAWPRHNGSQIQPQLDNASPGMPPKAEPAADAGPSGAARRRLDPNAA